jgi:peptidoglycan/LPS O-acetylase OafA/YrhL
MSTDLKTRPLKNPALLSARTDRSAPRPVRKFRPDIEGLRAIAVTLVVLSHLRLGFPGGFVGVDVFFVISGFLITRQLLGESARAGRISFAGFYARRARRILPAATVVIVGTMLACWKWDSPLEVRSDAISGLFSAFSGINWRLAAQGTNYFALGSSASPFQHFWSLAVEEQFYIVWPALIVTVIAVLGRRSGGRKPLIWTLLLIMAASLSLSVATTGSSPSWAYFGTQTRAWELASGALLAVSVTVWTRMPPALASQMSWLGLGLILLASLRYSSATEYPGLASVTPVLGSAFVIAGGCPGWSRSAELALRRSPMQFLGRTSYSWYLVHWPVLVILPLALGHVLTFTDKWAVVAGSLLLATVMYYAVEQPIRTRPGLARTSRRSLTLGAALVAVSAGTAAVVFNGVVIPGAGGGRGGATTVAAGGQNVTRAVAAGARLTALPVNVSPPLAQAANDKPVTTRKCLVGDTIAVPVPNATCTIGDLAATQTMAVVGDSHANAWTPALEMFAKTYHWKVVLYTKAACPPGIYPSDVDPITNRLYTQCNVWRRDVLSRIAALKPEIVLVTSELRTLDIDPGGMVQAVGDYLKDGARVIYLEDTPSPESIGPVPDCLARNPKSITTCDMSRSAPTTRLNGFIQRRIEATAVRQAGATIIDPTPWFCTTSICPAVINNMVVYEDASHTTATYVKWLAPVFSAALNKAVSTPAHSRR